MMSMDDLDETRPIDLSAWDVPDNTSSWAPLEPEPPEVPEAPETPQPEAEPKAEAPKPEKTTWQMGERERLRRAKKKNQRMIAAIIGFLAVAIVVLTICLTHKLYRDSHAKDEDSGVNILQLESEEDSDVFPGLYRPAELEYPEPYVEEEDPDTSINYFDQFNNSYDDYSSDENTVPIVSSISGDTSTSTTTGSTTTTTTTGTTSTSSSTTKTSTGTTSKTTTSTSSTKKTVTVKTLKTVTLYCSVTKATKGGTATLSYKAVNNQGTDVTNQCTVSFSAENCTVSNKTVTFDKVGTAKITATVHYKLSKLTTNTVSVTVSEAAATSTLASATLSCSNTAPTLGQTGNLSVKVVDNSGADVTSKSTITYTPSNCTVSGSVVTFGTEGSASVTASVTYNGKTISTNTLSFTVSKAAPVPQTVTLSCTPSTDVKQGDTGTLSAQVVDASGADITSSCTLSFEAVSGCTISGTAVTFDTVGSAVLKVTATSGGQSVSGELTVTVSAQPALKSCQLVLSSTTVEKGSQQTLSVVATDENGNEIKDVEIQYSGDKCSISGNTVTFDEAGTATISATVTYNGVATVADPVTVYVQVNRSLSDGTKINVSDVSQKAEDSTYGYSLGLPSYFTAESSETAGEKLYSYEKLGMTVKLIGADRTEDTTTTVSQLYRDRMAALEADGATLGDSSVDRDKGCYVLRWEKDDTVYEETVYVGEKATNTLLISYSTEQKDISSEIAEYISATFQAGDLTVTHE